MAFEGLSEKLSNAFRKLRSKGKLTEDEFETIKSHTVMGRKMLESTKNNLGATTYLAMAEDIAYYHHEWWDGCKRGYPERLSGTDIPLSARIMAVADVFDALVSRRPYKDPMTMEEAMDIIVEESGTHFDPDIVDVFKSVIDEFRIASNEKL